ncbi:MAG: DUF1573 domain-containing protein [Bacteroidota bacterium]|nr:DUF1573 domain-containing protein [Bacteroidota bacterium]
MKVKIFLVAIIFSNFIYAQDVDLADNVSKQEEKTSGATIDFESKVIDYGTLDFNADGNREFVFTNNGTEPLIIKTARGNCGCTVPDWPKEPIMPGSNGAIKVKYATNRPGRFTKQVTLSTNIDTKPIILTIKGEVLPAPKKESLEKNTTGAPKE